MTGSLPPGRTAIHSLSWFGQPVNITLAVDGLTILMLFVVSLVSFFIGLYSISYMKRFGAKPYYYALILLMVAGMNGILLSADLFLLYIFMEIAALASYGIVAFDRGRLELEGAIKYLLLSAIGSGLVLFGIVFVFATTGGVGFETFASYGRNHPAAFLCLIPFIAGFGLKAALVPFHTWMPDAYSAAPATLPAISSGLLIKVAGVYALVRVCFTVFGMNATVSHILMYFGILSIIFGAFLALGQKNMKRMLAYSSISQVGYIAVGIGLGTPLGIAGGLFHLLNHSLFKPLLFMNAGAVEEATGTGDMEKMGGLGKKMPLTSAANIIGLLSTAGVPPLNGFWSKLLIVFALVQAKLYLYASIAIIVSVVTLWYFLLIQRRVFFGPEKEQLQAVREAPGWSCFSMVLLALLCIITGIFFPFFVKEWINPAAEALFSGIPTPGGWLPF